MESDIHKLLQRLMHPDLPAIDLTLNRMWNMLEALGNPHQQLAPIIHVAGTNGKGSTVAMLRAIYQSAGYRVQAYTSPHLVRFHERIALVEDDITDPVLLPALQRVVNAAQHYPVTFFEATTAAAFLCFASEKADILLLEVGMGGRLDATNVIEKKLASVITPIGYDHQEFLGETLTSIAYEKAGIMQTGTPCITAPQTEEVFNVLRKHARLMHVSLHTALPYQGAAALLGEHQHINAGIAATVATLCNSTLPITEAHIQAGIMQAKWPARLQLLHEGPLLTHWKGHVYLDGAHNAAAAKALAAFLKDKPRPITMLLAMFARKDARAFFHEVAEQVDTLVVLPMSGTDAAHTANDLKKAAIDEGIQSVQLAENLSEATQMLAHGSGTLLITGSLHFAGEILKNHR